MTGFEGSMAPPWFSTEHSGATGPGRLVSLHLPLRQYSFPWKSEGGGLICRDRSQREGPTTALDAVVLCVNFIYDKSGALKLCSE